MQAKVNNGQSLIDLTIQHAGSVEALFDLMHLNGLNAVFYKIADNIVNKN
jgi:hypothetical protein